MNIVLWISQVLLSLAFLMTGTLKAFQYERAKAQLEWVATAPRRLVTFIGSAEILGAIGLILPALTGILPWLTPLAAVGLAIVMLLAAGFNIIRGDYSHIAIDAILFVLAAIVAYGRFMSVPLY
jgi:uncharacterized membrane protein YphA (DoxX/SURF4 family)